MAATRAEVEVEQQRYQDLFEFAPDGYLVTDINGVIQEANRAVAQLLNVSQKFLVGKPLYIFFAQEVRDDLFAKLIQLQQVNFAQEWEVRLQPRNNTPFSAALTVAAMRKPDGDLTGLRWLLRDISDRKKAELQESEQRFRQLAENVNQVFWISDVKTAEIIYISPAYEKLWGCTCNLNEECKFFIDNILPEDRDRIIPLIEQQKQGELIEAEYRIVRPDGKICWISTRSFPIYNELGQIYRACGIVEDITQRKQAELALWQQSKREQALNRFTDAVRKTLDLKTIFATAAQEISQILDVDCVEIQQYLPQSQIWLTVADYPQHPNTSCSLGTVVSDVGNEISSRLKQFEVVQIDDSKTLKNAVSQKLAQVYLGAWLLVPLHFQDLLWGSLCLKSDRAYHWSEWEVDLVKEIAVQLAIAIQQGQFYQQLNELNANLEFQVQERTVELQQKVEELQHLNILKDDFLSTVSHELRSPLTNMKMSIQMLKINGLAERQQRYLDVLQTECDREINLINDLLDLQQLQAESYPISLTDAINLQESLPKIVEPFHYRAVERQQFLKLDIFPDIPPLISHLTGLERILAELLNNACKYTPTGGEIIFRVSHDQQHTPVTTFTISNPAEIPAAALPRIFEKFYRVPNADRWKQGGTGLGLSLVQKLVEQLGGTISVESEGGWTSFMVQFPVASLVGIQLK